ncbi:MAG: aminomethyltransferase family protein [Nitrospinota bacterium]
MRSPIHEAHAKLGAVTTDWDGWEVPAHYGDPASEYAAARRGVVRTDRSHRTQLRLTGGDRLKFLQNILANEVGALPPGGGTYAALLTPMGKLVADFRVSVLAESVLLDTEAVCRETAFPHLDKFNLGYDCEITDETNDLGTVTLVGPDSEETVRGVLGEAPGPDPPYGCLEIDWKGTGVVAAATDRLGPPAIDLIVPTAGLSPLWEAFGAVPPAGVSALEMLRIEGGVPRLGPDMDASVNPIEAGLLDAINFEKGCYVGQEVLAKIDSLGHVNRSLVGLRIDGETAPEPGAPLFEDGKKVGHVTSGTLSPSLGGVVALGYVHRKLSTPGQALEADLGGKKVPVRVAERPFIS